MGSLAVSNSVSRICLHQCFSKLRVTFNPAKPLHFQPVIVGHRALSSGIHNKPMSRFNLSAESRLHLKSRPLDNPVMRSLLGVHREPFFSTFMKDVSCMSA